MTAGKEMGSFFLVARKIKAMFEKRLMHLFTGALLGNQKLIRKEGDEMVGRLDLTAQDEIMNLLMEEFPGIPILSEEKKFDWPPKAYKEFFLVDSCDGTHNIGALLPMCGVMLALVKNGDIVFSVVWLPFSPEGFYFACRGEGTWQFMANGHTRKLAVSGQKDLGEAFIYLEGPTRKAFSPDYQFPLKVTHATKRMRFGPSSCWSGTRVASGGMLPMSVDALIATGNKPTDNLPILLLVEEAGGMVTDHYGKPWSFENCASLVYSNGHLHKAIVRLNLLRQKPERYRNILLQQQEEVFPE